MEIAIWIITVCEVIRAMQNMIQIMTIKNDAKKRDNAYSEFVQSLKMSDKEFVKALLEEFENQEKET